MIRLLILLFSSALLVVSGCRQQNKVEVNKAINDDSLIEWTDDTILSANRPLVLHMDTLYRAVRSDSANEVWMMAYREQLIDYYDRNNSGDGSMTDYEKANDVISEADSLWSIGENKSTMGIVVDNGVKYSRLVFAHYNELIKNDNQLLRVEFDAWNKLQSILSDIFYNLVELKYYGGSICNVIKSQGTLAILEAHIDLYKKESEKEFEPSGVYAECAKELLIDCCRQAVESNFIEDYGVEYEGEQKDYYKALPEKTLGLIEQLSPAIDEWLESRQLWIEEVASEKMSEYYQLDSGGVLVKLASVVCEI